MSQFTSYNDISINAFSFNAKNHDIINRKVEILDSIKSYYNKTPESILFVGFNPWILGVEYKSITVTEISTAGLNLLDKFNVKYQYVDKFEVSGKFDWVVVADEYFTFAESELDQQYKLKRLLGLTNNYLITTLRDYKNQSFKEKEFSHPLAIKNANGVKIFLEFNNYDYNEKNTWNSTVYELNDEESLIHGPYNRTSMYFKQLAKFSKEYGANNFLIHKNLMYKSLIKKNYEHVISIPIK